MPISLSAASPENWKRVGTFAFHPNRPTAGRPVPRSITIAARPATAGASRACESASAWKTESGVASTRPSPNTGWVRRAATTFASGGMTSGPKLKPATGPIPWSWRSVPPFSVRGSNPPSASRRPYRVSRRWLLPPIAGGESWHWVQTRLVEDRPRPLFTDSCFRNASSPSRKLASSSVVTEGSGSPNLPAVRSAVKGGPASGAPTVLVPQAWSAVQRSSAATSWSCREGTLEVWPRPARARNALVNTRAVTRGSIPGIRLTLASMPTQSSSPCKPRR